MPFEGSTTDQDTKTHLKITLGERIFSRNMLLSVWPMLSAFCWLLYLVAFGAGSLYLFAASGEIEEVIKVVGLIAALHIGGLIATYLATLSENARGEGHSAKFPLVVSLQANFVEAIGIAGVLLFVAGKQVLEILDENSSSVTGDRPLLRELMSLFGHESKWSFVAVTIVLFIVVVIVAHIGFLLLKQRGNLITLFTGIFRNEGEPPIGSDNPTARLAYLKKLTAEFIQKALNEEGCIETIQKWIADIEKEIEQLSAKIAKETEEIVRLQQNKAELAEACIPLSGYETRLAAQAVASERSLSSTILQKALKFLNSGLSVTNSTNHLFDAGIEKLEKLIAEQRQAIVSLEDKRKKFESDLRHHSELKAYFDQRIKEIEAEIIALTAHVAHIDKTNVEWRMPFEWVARITPDKFGVDHAIPEKAYNNGKLVSSDDKLQQINKGTFVLFLVTTALSIFDDILIDIARKQHPSEFGLLNGTFDAHTSNWLSVFLGLFAVYFGLRCIATLGLVGSWRTIITGYSRDGDEISPPKIADAVRVSLWNLAGVLLFFLCAWGIGSLLFAANDLTVGKIYSFFGNKDPSEAFAVFKDMPIGLHDIYQLEWQWFALAYIPLGAALLVLLPFAVYGAERLFRKFKDQSLLELWARIIAFAIVVLAALTLAGFGIFKLFSQFTPEQPKVEPSKPIVPTVQCPLIKEVSASGAEGDNRFVTTWKIGKDARAVTDISGCRFDLDQANVNYIVVVGAASQEGRATDAGLIKQQDLANNRIDTVLAQLDKQGIAPVNKKIKVYYWSLGVHKQTLDRPTEEQSAYQRPLFILAGHIDPSQLSEPKAGQGSNGDGFDAEVARITKETLPATYKVRPEDYDVVTPSTVPQDRPATTTADTTKPQAVENCAGKYCRVKK